MPYDIKSKFKNSPLPCWQGYERVPGKAPGSDVVVLKKGDEIYYDKAAGFNIEIKQEQYKIIKEQDVVIVL